MGRVIPVAAVLVAMLVAVVWLAFGAKVRERERERERERPVTASPQPPSPSPAPAPAASPAPTPDAFPRTLRGTVRDAATGDPIPRAFVSARSLARGAIRGTHTDAAGRFAIGDLPPDRYDVTATAEGWLLAPSVPREVPDPAPLDFRLERGLTVRGRVVDDAGRPVTAGARVRVELAAPPSQRYSAGSAPPIGTDADGRFAVPGVPPGASYRLTARAPGYSPAELELPPVVAPDGLEGVVLTLGRFIVAGDVSLAPGAGVLARAPGAIRIEVRRPSLPLEGGHGHGHDRGGDGWPDWTLSLDEPGAFELAVPQSGRLEVRARAEAPGLATPWTAVLVSTGKPGRASLVLERVPPAAPEDPGVPVRGEFFGLNGKPLAGTIVRFDRDGAAPVTLEVDHLGGLERGGLAVGRYEVTFREPATPELRTWRRTLVVEPRVIATLEHAEVAPRGSIEGTARADGVAIVPAGGPDRPPAFGFTSFVKPDAEGRFVFAAVPPGIYTVLRPGSDPVEVTVASGAVTVVPPPR